MTGSTTPTPVIATRNTVMVAGSRDIVYESDLYKAQIKFFMNQLHATNPIHYLIDGGHSGVDAVIREWRTENNVPGDTYHADWDSYGPRAGAVRNKELVEKVDPIHLMVLFPGSLGTNSMKAFAESRRIGIVYYDGLCETEEEWKEWLDDWEKYVSAPSLREYEINDPTPETLEEQPPAQ